MAEQTAQTEQSKIQVVHAIPGRVRLRVTGKDIEPALDILAQQLRQEDGVYEVGTNEATGSAVIAFDANRLPLPHLLEGLQHWGVNVTMTNIESGNAVTASNTQQQTANQKDPFAAWKSPAYWKKQGRSFLPIIAGLMVTRGFGLLGWRALFAYIITANTTRQIIDQLDTETPVMVPAATPKTAATIPTPKSNGKSAPASVETPSVASASASTYKMIHAIPGRVRFGVPRIAEDPQYARRLEKLIESTKGVTGIRVNSQAASIAITYDNRAVTDAEMRLHLAELIQSADEAKDVSYVATASAPTLTVVPPIPQPEPSTPPPPPEPTLTSEMPVSQPAPPATVETDEPADSPPDDLEGSSHDTQEATDEPAQVEPVVLEADQEIELATDEPVEPVALEADQEIEPATNEPAQVKPVSKGGGSKAKKASQKPAKFESALEVVSEEFHAVAAPDEPALPPPALETAIPMSEVVDEPALPPPALETNLKETSNSMPVPEASIKEKASLFYCLKQTARSTFQFLNKGQPLYNALALGWREAGMIRLKAIASLQIDNSPELDLRVE
ncbi:HMA2 domain-containing protein [Microcoleus sp. FACHB-672]|uniref:HMA2 domain-containing protein n=1 Tax=Microcoleus sp. FACHB-672 TaxID=2692825 RepID=UPI0016834718|nr:hypothetical protein [Microcoleus sp. FACHB-672]MBD2043340.1 hypothetical protein [Microcoleus sp. FACHB-672]